MRQETVHAPLWIRNNSCCSRDVANFTRSIWICLHIASLKNVSASRLLKPPIHAYLQKYPTLFAQSYQPQVSMLQANDVLSLATLPSDIIRQIVRAIPEEKDNMQLVEKIFFISCILNFRFHKYGTRLCLSLDAVNLDCRISTVFHSPGVGMNSARSESMIFMNFTRSSSYHIRSPVSMGVAKWKKMNDQTIFAHFRSASLFNAGICATSDWNRCILASSETCTPHRDTNR